MLVGSTDMGRDDLQDHAMLYRAAAAIPAHDEPFLNCVKRRTELCLHDASEL
jgi:hypothetical protein